MTRLGILTAALPGFLKRASRGMPDIPNEGSLFAVCFGYEPAELQALDRARRERPQPRRKRARVRHVGTTNGATDRPLGRRGRRLDPGCVALAKHRAAVAIERERQAELVREWLGAA